MKSAELSPQLLRISLFRPWLSMFWSAPTGELMRQKQSYVRSWTQLSLIVYFKDVEGSMLTQILHYRWGQTLTLTLMSHQYCLYRPFSGRKGLQIDRKSLPVVICPHWRTDASTITLMEILALALAIYISGSLLSWWIFWKS